MRELTLVFISEACILISKYNIIKANLRNDNASSVVKIVVTFNLCFRVLRFHYYFFEQMYRKEKNISICFSTSNTSIYKIEKLNTKYENGEILLK